MNKSFCVLLCLGIAACAPARYEQQQPVNMTFYPVNSKKFKSDIEAEHAMQMASNGCRAQAIQAAAQVPIPQRSSQIYVQNAPIVVGPQRGLDQIQNVDNSQNLIAAAQAGRADRAQDEKGQATFVACMNKAGYILR